MFVSLSGFRTSFTVVASAVAFATFVSVSRPGSPVRARVTAVFVIQCRIPLGASVVIGQAAFLAVRFDRGPLMVRIVTILS